MEKLSLNQLFQIPAEAVGNQKGKTCVGIDFGTSTTVVSLASYNARSKQVECITLHLVQKESDGNTVESELMPTIIAINKDGSPLVGEGAYKLKGNPEYTFEMMCEAVCKIEGFRYKSQDVFHGHSSEKRFIHITTEFINAGYIKSLSARLAEGQSLLIYGTMYSGN